MKGGTVDQFINQISDRQIGSGDPNLQTHLLNNLKRAHLCKGGCKKYIQCKCSCPRCDDTSKKLREGEWRRCKRCKKTWRASEYREVRPEDLAQGAGYSKQKGGSKIKQHYTCTFCGKYKYIEDMLKHVEASHLKPIESAVVEKGIESAILSGAGPQFYGKKSDKMVQVPVNVKKWALYAFKLKKIGFEGATETGWKRAKQLATKEYIPIQDLRYMRNWYARHIYTSYPGYKRWVDSGRPKDPSYHKHHAIQSWLTWGGDAGFRWVNSQKTVDMLNSYFNKNYKVMHQKQ